MLISFELNVDLLWLFCYLFSCPTVIDQFSAAAAAAYAPTSMPAIYPQTIPYQPYYQYYSVPMVSSNYCQTPNYHSTPIPIETFTKLATISETFQNVPAIWPQSYQGMYTLNVRK